MTTTARPRNKFRTGFTTVNTKHIPGYPWLRTTQAAQHLGVAVEWIQWHCREGAWALGVQYRHANRLDKAKPIYQINVHEVADWMATPLDQR